MDEIEAGESIPTCPRCGQPLEITEGDRCRLCGTALEFVPDGPAAQPDFWSMPEMRYPDAYTWLVLFSGLDILLTMFVLFLWSGFEVNPIARAVIETMGPYWAILFKLGTVVLVIVICEIIGRRDDRMGRGLAKVFVVMSAIPVAYTFVLLLRAGPAPVAELRGDLG